MIKDSVVQTGLRVEASTGGYYNLTVWHKLDGGGRMHDITYHDLSWAELIDVALAELHGRKPGYRLGEGWYQPPLPF